MKKSHYPMKTVDEIASRLRGTNTFSILDAKSGFRRSHHIYAPLAHQLDVTGSQGFPLA